MLKPHFYSGNSIMMLSHKKYQEIASGFANCVPDEKLMEELLQVIKGVFNYSEDKTTYNRSDYDKLKQRRAANGETSWTDYRKKYYEDHKEELKEKRRMYYHQKKQKDTADLVNEVSHT
jgi:hypothetical protein